MLDVTKKLAGAIALLVAGCGAFERDLVDPSVAAGVVVVNSEAPPTCRYVGPVSGDKLIGDLAAARAELRKNAAVLGGNYVQIDMTESRPGGYEIQGRLFACAAAPPPAPRMAPWIAEAQVGEKKELVSPRPLPGNACEPDCSPGYACVQGACVSACNPACGQGERCGADRSCRAIITPEKLRSAENHYPEVVEGVGPNRGSEAP